MSVVAVDLPPAPRSIDDGVVIFVCEHEGTAHSKKLGFMTTVKDPPKGRPNCKVCGKPCKHVSPATAQRLLAVVAG